MKRKPSIVILSFAVMWMLGAFWPTSARAFALLGPYEDWMQPSNGFRVPVSWYSSFPVSVPGDIGGPMWISNGYRWNVSVVTYGFDSSFTNFFGSSGVAAVEGAIQIINSLPHASIINPADYPTYTVAASGSTQAQSLYDLQSVTLSLLLEQLGLASPTLSIYVLHNWNLQESNLNFPVQWFPQYIFRRNYDSTSLEPTKSVNGFSYDFSLWDGISNGIDEALAVPEEDDLFGSTTFTAVADKMLGPGQIYTGLTSDDVAGLSYLYSGNNVNYEPLISGVSGAGSNANSWVNGAPRPGVEKITFVPHSFNSSGSFLPMTNQYVDSYISNGTVMHQQVQRIIPRPDFLFTVGDAGTGYPMVQPYVRTGTSNWINNAGLNGRCSAIGPGIIQPPVTIMFDKLGPNAAALGSNTDSYFYLEQSETWGSFDQSTNAPIIYPAPQTGCGQFLVRIWFPSYHWFPIPSGKDVELSLTGKLGRSFVLESSSNLTDWIPLETNVNNGSIWTVTDETSFSARYYRLIPGGQCH